MYSGNLVFAFTQHRHKILLWNLCLVKKISTMADYMGIKL